MLVFLKEPMGSSIIDGRRIYGRYFNYGKFGPTEIPKKTYINNKDVLEEAEYNKRILEEKFGGEFPDVKFKITKLIKLPFDKTIELAAALGIEYIKSRKPSRGERLSLRRAIAHRLTD